MEEWDLLNLDSDMKTYFPKIPFTLKDFQKRAIENVVEHGNTLCIMPTGGGKSMIYWLAAARLQGIAIVIFPLTTLIAEQAKKLEEQGYEVLQIHGRIDVKKQMRLLAGFANGENNPDFIFLSPEKMATDGFLEYCLRRRKDDIRLLVIDEVHCVSQWGISFRPFYKRIPDFMDKLFGADRWGRVLALTATLNPKEMADICSAFKIDRHNIIKQDLLMRSEIQLHVQKFTDEDEKTKKFWDIVKIHADEKILVYVYRKQGRRSVEDLCAAAVEKGYHAECFHGDMDSGNRMDIVERFWSGETKLVFATNAFGMGIDIRDIRVVIHFMIPESVEQYYQEVGRAARDGCGANAYLLYSNKNIEVKRQYFINASFPTENKLRETYGKIAGAGIGYKTLAYFDDEEIQLCLPYFLENGLLNIECKGFADLASLTDIKDGQLQQYFDSTKKKGFIRTLKKNPGLTPACLSESVYRAIVDGDAGVTKPLERWLVLNVMKADIDEDAMKAILGDIEEKKQYKYALLDYFIYLIENCQNTQDLHQEIAKYLGTEKHNLARIYKTADGKHVRSKSEVIICNLLHAANLKYEYEEKLFYADHQWIEPDFTVTVGDKKIYWEHLGMLGKEDYDDRWLEKADIYAAYYPGQLVKTYESGALSKDAQQIIEKMKQMA